LLFVVVLELEQITIRVGNTVRKLREIKEMLKKFREQRGDKNE